MARFDFNQLLPQDYRGSLTDWINQNAPELAEFFGYSPQIRSNAASERRRQLLEDVLSQRSAAVSPEDFFREGGEWERLNNWDSEEERAKRAEQAAANGMTPEEFDAWSRSLRQTSTGLGGLDEHWRQVYHDYNTGREQVGSGAWWEAIRQAIQDEGFQSQLADIDSFDFFQGRDLQPGATGFDADFSAFSPEEAARRQALRSVWDDILAQSEGLTGALSFGSQREAMEFLLNEGVDPFKARAEQWIADQNALREQARGLYEEMSLEGEYGDLTSPAGWQSTLDWLEAEKAYRTAKSAYGTDGMGAGLRGGQQRDLGRELDRLEQERNRKRSASQGVWQGSPHPSTLQYPRIAAQDPFSAFGDNPPAQASPYQASPFSAFQSSGTMQQSRPAPTFGNPLASFNAFQQRPQQLRN